MATAYTKDIMDAINEATGTIDTVSFDDRFPEADGVEDDEDLIFE